MSETPNRFIEALARLHSHAEAHKEQARHVSIAISRQAGSRGADIARAVGALLGWPVYDHELLTRIAEEKGLHSRLLERLDERHVSWLEDVINSFATHEPGREGAYLRHLLEQFATLGKAGHCIIVGRGAAQIMPPDSTLRVRVVAPHAARVAHIQKSKNLSEEEAERWVNQTDANRTRFVADHFQKDASDPLAYDLVLNSSRFSNEECADVIMQAARILEKRLHERLGV